MTADSITAKIEKTDNGRIYINVPDKWAGRNVILELEDFNKLTEDDLGYLEPFLKKK